MPELPDITLYIEALRQRLLGQRLERSRVRSPFLLRSVDPPLDAAHGAKVAAFERLGKRIAIGFDNDVWLVLHLMIAGRLQWRTDWPTSLARQTALALGFESGTLLLTEAGTKKRASLHVVRGREGLAAHQPGGIELDRIGAAEFEAALKRGNHTLKRALTDPRLISGIGNAYSDEILHRARLSPVTLTSRLTSDESARLFAATREVLGEWLARLRANARGEFPSKVTAFHGEMAVHGKYGEPCPVCGTKVQRIRYADNETNYCPRCQTNGKLLADRALSRLLKQDWPKSIDELDLISGG
jgi:formamidopyrimidine-DNA glycosylase